jgi:hypothetical protein
MAEYDYVQGYVAAAVGSEFTVTQLSAATVEILSTLHEPKYLKIIIVDGEEELPSG